MKKNFTSPTEQFLSPGTLQSDFNPYGIKEIEERLPPPLAPIQEQREAEQGQTIPKGYRITRARKDCRLQVLLPAEVNRELAELATKEGISKNELINTIFYEYLEREVL